MFAAVAGKSSDCRLLFSADDSKSVGPYALWLHSSYHLLPVWWGLCCYDDANRHSGFFQNKVRLKQMSESENSEWVNLCPWVFIFCCTLYSYHTTLTPNKLGRHKEESETRSLYGRFVPVHLLGFRRFFSSFSGGKSIKGVWKHCDCCLKWTAYYLMAAADAAWKLESFKWPYCIWRVFQTAGGRGFFCLDTELWNSPPLDIRTTYFLMWTHVRIAVILIMVTAEQKRNVI